MKKMEITIKRDGLNLHGLLKGTNKIKNDIIAILMHGFQQDFVCSLTTSMIKASQQFVLTLMGAEKVMVNLKI